MKKQEILKSVQLIVFILLTAVCVYCIVLDNEIYHLIAEDKHIRLVCVMLWITQLLSFLFILLDFNFAASFKKDYRELDYAVHSDPLSGLANRLGADTLIEKYMDMPVPDDFGCCMLELSNIREINELHGHAVGNALIRDFAEILNSASFNNCYVARNGGNKYLAIFEHSDSGTINAFLRELEENIKNYNAVAGNYPIRYRYGVAIKESADKMIKGVPDLIALANRRIYEK